MRRVLTSDERIELWEAINEYARAVGGDTSAATISAARMDAVANVEGVVSAHLNGRAAPAPQGGTEGADHGSVRAEAEAALLDVATKRGLTACDGGAGDEPCMFPRCLLLGCEAERSCACAKCEACDLTPFEGEFCAFCKRAHPDEMPAAPPPPPDTPPPLGEGPEPKCGKCLGVEGRIITVGGHRAFSCGRAWCGAATIIDVPAVVPKDGDGEACICSFPRIHCPRCSYGCVACAAAAPETPGKERP